MQHYRVIRGSRGKELKLALSDPYSTKHVRLALRVGQGCLQIFSKLGKLLFDVIDQDRTEAIPQGGDTKVLFWQDFEI